MRHIEQRRYPWQHILAHGRRWREQRVVIRHQRHDQSGDFFGEELRELRRFRDQHLTHAVELGGLLCDGAQPCPGDENIDIAADLTRRRKRLRRRGRERLIVVIGEEQDGHLENPRLVLELVDQRRHAIDLDAGLAVLGSASETIFSLGAMSTPSASGVVSSIGFFFAFMIFGSDA